ncbi:MAG: HAMP domain-containing protein [Zoogloeaceae bacterium]|jgi:two-component system sensor histidine kinase GlrK|nr:HAMP domain-containing protein [Zoogloeaceae bacterium]
MNWITSRQALIVGFSLIIVFLGGAALQSWQMLAQLSAQSRENSEQSVRTASVLQELRERGTDLERNSRQYLLVRQDTFRASFDATLAQALRLTETLEAQQEALLRPLLQEWRRAARKLADSLDSPTVESTLGAHLTRLAEIYGNIQRASQQWVTDNNQRTLADLESKRRQLLLQFFFALLIAILTAIALCYWLTRPLRQIEQAILLMGHGHLDGKIRIDGPADLRSLGARLESLRRRLSNLKSDRKELFHYMTQEMKVPVNAIREGCDLFNVEADAESQRSLFDMMRHNAELLQRQLESILRMGVVFEFNYLQRQSVRLSAFLQEVVAAQAERSAALNAHIRLDVPDVSVQIDADKVRVVLEILLANALDFSPAGGEILLRATMKNDLLRLECRDQGAGIAEEDIDRIFKPFYRGKTHARTASSQRHGVGLTIARELSSIMGGAVCYARDETGSCFYVEISCES